MDKLEDLYRKHEGERLSPSQITHLISFAVPFRDVNFYTVKSLGILAKDVHVSGLYDIQEDEIGLPSIEIELTYFKRKTAFTLNKQGLSFKQWRRLCFDVVAILGHEYVHQEQHRGRDFKMGKAFKSRETDDHLKQLQEYLGHPDEIDAYSFSAAADMAQCLRLNEPVDLKLTGVYDQYRTAFGDNHSIVSKLEKRSLKYYNILKEQYYGQQSNRTRVGLR
jgi:hypothetical protein